MENKYYTPELHEFHIGFEFEVLNNEGKFYIPGLAKNEWSSIESNFGIFTSVEKIQRLILDKQIRVKHLDREDIESLGWKYSIFAKRYFLKSVGLDDDEINSGKGIWLLHTGIFESKITDRWVIVDCRYALHQIRFDGNLKNKSELRKLMQQLNINSGGK